MTVLVFAIIQLLVVVSPFFTGRDLDMVLAAMAAAPNIALIIICGFPRPSTANMLKRDIGPTLREGESEAQFMYRKAGLWFVGGLCFPLGIIFAQSIVDGPYGHSHLAPFVVAVLPIFGVACLLKGLGAAWSAWRLR